MEQYQKVAYITLRQDNGSLLLNVPLLVRVADLQQSGLSNNQDQLMHRISEIMCRHYEQRLTDYFQNYVTLNPTTANTSACVPQAPRTVLACIVLPRHPVTL